MRVYLKEDIPERYHHQKNRRIAPILAVAESGWYILRDENSNAIAGTHGFEPCNQAACSPLFLAGGPAFKNGTRTPEVRHIDIYELVCDILNLRPSPNNGTLAAIDFIMECPGASGQSACIAACPVEDSECVPTCRRRCPADSNDGSLSGGEIAGIVVGCVVGATLVVFAAMAVASSKKGTTSELEEKLT